MRAVPLNIQAPRVTARTVATTCRSIVGTTHKRGLRLSQLVLIYLLRLYAQERVENTYI